MVDAELLDILKQINENLERIATAIEADVFEDEDEEEEPVEQMNSGQGMSQDTP